MDSKSDKTSDVAPLDPLKRVFIPTELRQTNGTFVFRTCDEQVYVRRGDGSIRRANHKARGKAARAADKLARRRA